MELPLLGPSPPPDGGLPRMPWHWRLREALSAYLPLLLMALLVLATWWLVKNTPGAPPEDKAAAVRHDPDYTMQQFTLQRFGDDGRLLVQVEGDQLRHYPDTDTLEIDAVRIQAFSADGSVTHATARRALSNGDASEVQLLGGARVDRSATRAGVPAMQFEGEFLHAFLRTEQLRSHLPVLLRQGSSEIRAGGMEYNHLTQQTTFKGPVRARFVPAGRPAR
ncbi:LPS export ABC transporter periplasmic protein LptC [Aquincola sp. MAHUQ-54]|uniref:LPS export ABC transporter periplasmic protein LptC n=1 Tax=Aquincola agrisoli TaxID=3119538 RepID=A0AAW9QAH8_9BURK